MPVRYQKKTVQKKMIYITEFGVIRTAISHSRGGGGVLMAVQRLRFWPTLKSTILEQGPLFQLSDILYTGTEIKHDIICRYHSYHTK